MIRVLPTIGSRRKPVVFFEDAGEARFVAEHFHSPEVPFLNFVFSNLHPQIAYRPELGVRMYQYRTQGGAIVPLCYRLGGSHLGIIPILDEAPTRNEVASARSYIKQMPHAKVLFVHRGRKDIVIDRKLRVISLAQIV